MGQICKLINLDFIVHLYHTVQYFILSSIAPANRELLVLRCERGFRMRVIIDVLDLVNGQSNAAEEQPVDDGASGELLVGPGAGGNQPRVSEVKKALPPVTPVQEEMLRRAKRYAMEQSVQQVTEGIQNRLNVRLKGKKCNAVCVMFSKQSTKIYFHRQSTSTLVSAYGNNSRKWTAPLTDTFSQGCPLMRELTVFLYSTAQKQANHQTRPRLNASASVGGRVRSKNKRRLAH